MRPLALTIVSYPSLLDPLLEEAAAFFARLTSEARALERCQEPDEVVDLARKWKRRGYAIETLDLFGHGGPGELRLGDGALFKHDGTGFQLARPLGAQLAPTARVRLIGCRTAAGDVGASSRRARLLLVELERRLGARREAWGTIGYVGLQHYRADGEVVRGVLRRGARARPGRSK